MDYPVLGVSSLKDSLAVKVIKDYRTPLLFYDLKGNKIGEENHDNIEFMDSEGSSLFLVETSFNLEYLGGKEKKRRK